MVRSQLDKMDHHAIDVHAIKVANYALMIATRVNMIRKESDEEDEENE